MSIPSTSSSCMSRSDLMKLMNYYGSKLDSMIYYLRKRCFSYVLAYIIKFISQMNEKERGNCHYFSFIQ